MSIEVRCPGGHALRVKDKYAGKTGRCPHCGGLVRVPQSNEDLEREVLEVLDSIADDTLPVHQETAHHEQASDVSLLGSSVIRGKISKCPKCGHKVVVGSNRICPHCNSYFTHWS